MTAATVVRGPRDRVREHGVRRRELLERGRRAVARAVWVPPQRELPPRPAQLLVVRAFMNAEQRVIIGGERGRHRTSAV